MHQASVLPDSEGMIFDSRISSTRTFNRRVTQLLRDFPLLTEVGSSAVDGGIKFFVKGPEEVLWQLVNSPSHRSTVRHLGFVKFSQN